MNENEQTKNVQIYIKYWCCTFQCNKTALTGNHKVITMPADSKNYLELLLTVSKRVLIGTDQSSPQPIQILYASQSIYTRDPQLAVNLVNDAENPTVNL